MIAFGYTAATLWDLLASDELPESSPELTEGRRTYAAEQADKERETCGMLERKWAAILRRADAYLMGSLMPEVEAAVTVEMDIGDELDPEKEEALLEGEEE
jgi:hypothetical protein